MSVQLKKLVDSRIDSASTLSATHDAVLGPSNIVRQAFKPTSTSASTLEYVIQTPGLAVYMSRKVMLDITIPFKFKVRNYNTGGPVYITPGVNCGPCAFPVNSMIQTATVQISTSSFTTQVQQTLPLVKRLLQRPSTRRTVGITASGLGDTQVILPTDQSSFFQNTIESGNDVKAEGCYGSNAGFNLKITEYRDVNGNPTTGGCPAAQATAGQITAPTDTWVYGYLNTTEPLLCQPFEIDDELPAFINVNLISVRLNLSALGADLCRLIRFQVAGMITQTPQGGAATAMPSWQPSDLQLDDRVANVFSDSLLITQFLSPPPTAVVPTKSIYPTTYMNPLPTGDTSTTSAGPTDIVSNVITLNTAPDAVAIYFVPQFDSPSGVASPYQPVTNGRALQMEDYVSKIRSIDITWNNNPSLLRTFTQQELWQRSYQNGLPQSLAIYSQNMRDTDLQRTTVTNPLWCGGTTVNGGATVVASSGGCILLALNKDIPVEPGVAAGVAGVYTLQVKATVETLFSTSTRGTLYVVPINSQYLILNAGATSDLLQTVATEEQVAATPASGEVQNKALLGGSEFIMGDKVRAARSGGIAHLAESAGGYAVGGSSGMLLGSAAGGGQKRARGDAYMM